MQKNISMDRATGSHLLSVLEGYWFQVALFVVSVTGIYIQAVSYINYDAAWGLYAANEYLHGAKLYVDIIEINPPLFFFLYMPSVAFSGYFGLGHETVFNCYVFLAITASLAFSWHVLEKLDGFSKTCRQFFILVFAASVLLLPMQEFGEREHFLVLFIMPYLLLAVLRLQDRDVGLALAVTIGVVSFFGFALKPHFLLVPVLVELYILYRKRDIRAMFRAETWVLGLLLVAYLAIIILVFPEYLDLASFGVEIYNAGYNRTLHHVLTSQTPYLYLMTFLLLLDVSMDEGHLGEWKAVFLLSAAGFFVAALAQKKGYYYHLLPALVLTMQVAAMYLYSLVATIKAEAGTGVKAGLASFSLLQKAFMFLLLAWMLSIFALPLKYGAREAYGVQNIYNMTRSYEKSHDKKVRSFTFLSIDFLSAYPTVFMLDAKWASRFPSLWLVPGIEKRKAALAKNPDRAAMARLKRAEDYSVNSVVEDLRKRKPDIVFVMKDSSLYQFGEKGFDYLGYFSRFRAFRDVWQDYRFVRQYGDIGLYERK